MELEWSDAPSDTWEDRTERARSRIKKEYWNESGGVVREAENDGRIVKDHNGKGNDFRLPIDDLLQLLHEKNQTDGRSVEDIKGEIFVERWFQGSDLWFEG